MIAHGLSALGAFSFLSAISAPSAAEMASLVCWGVSAFAIAAALYVTAAKSKGEWFE